MPPTETARPPESTLTALVDELRTIGVGVSVGEHLDAARALAAVPLADTRGRAVDPAVCADQAC